MKKILNYYKFVFFQFIVAFCAASAFAQSPQITYHGRIIDGITNLPITAAAVTFRLQIRTPGPENCLLYEEQQVKNLSTTDGIFVIGVNNGSGTRLDASGYSVEQIFSNKQSFSFAGGACAVGTTYTPGFSDARRMIVNFNDGSFAGWEPLPSQTLAYTPMAVESLNVGGYPAASLLRFVDGFGVPFNTSPLSNVQYTQLLSLIGGTSPLYVQAGGNAGGFTGALAGDVTGNQGTTVTARLRGTPVSAVAPVAGQYLIYDGANWAPQAGSGGTVTNVSSGNAYLSVVNPTLNPTLTINVGTVANTVAAGDDSRIVGAFQTATALGGDVSGNLPNPTVATVGGRTAAQINTSVTDTIAATDAATASVLVKRDASGNSAFTGVQATNVSGRNMYFFDGTNTNSINIRAPAAAIGSNLTWTLPNSNGTAGYVLSTDGAGVLNWQSPTAGSVTTVTASTPLASSGGFSPNITIQVANTTQNGYLATADWNTFNNKLSTTLNNGLVWVGNVGNVAAPRFLNITDVKSSVAGNWFAGGACPTGQELTYSVVNDQVTCQAYSLTSAQVTGALTFTPLNQVLNNTQIFVGNAGNVAAGVAMSGDTTIDNTGTVTISNNAVITGKINNLAVTNAKINDVAFGKITGTPTTIAGYGITDAVLINAGGITEISAANIAARPVAGVVGRMFVSNDTQEIFRDNGVAWVRVGSSNGLGGTVTNVTGTAPIAVATGTTTPVVSMTQSNTTTDGYVSSTDWNTFNNKLTSTLNNGMVFAGNVGNVATGRFLNISDIKSTVAGNWFAGGVCPTGQMLTYSAVNDQVTCQAFALSSAQVTSALTYTPLTQVLNNGQIYVGSAGNVATGVAMTGDTSIDNTGAVAIVNNAVTTAKINNLAVTNAKINDVAWGKITATPTTIAGYGITDAVLINGGGISDMSAANIAARPAPGTVGRVFISNDTQEIFRDNGAAWVRVGSSNGLGGTVTNVTGTGPISVATGTTTPVVSMTQSNTTTDGYVSAADWNLFNNKLPSALTSTQIFVGSVGGVATGVAMSGDTTIINSGAVTIANNAITTTKINNLAVTDAKINDVAWSKITTTPTTITGYGITDATRNVGVGAGNIVTTFQSGNTAGRPAVGTDGRIYIDTQAGITYRDNGAAWVNVGSSTGSGGTVTSIIAGTGLTGGTITSTGTIGLGTELTGLNALATNGVVKRTGAGVYGASAVGLATADVTGTLPVGNGGTGATTIASGSLVVGSGAGAVNTLAGGSAGNLVYATGAATWASGSADTAGVVDKTTAQAIAGAKTFSSAITAGPTGVAAGNGGEVRYNELTASGANYVGFKSADVLAANIIWTLPGADGTANQVLQTNGGGVLNWVSTATGTVTSVTSANADIAVATTTTTPVLTLNSGVGANQIVKLNGTSELPAVSGANLTSLNAGNITAGTLGVANGGTGVTTIGSGNIVIGGGAAAVTSLASGANGNVIYGTGVASWASGTPDTAGLVDKTSTQAISGAKTFGNTVRMSNQNLFQLGDAGANQISMRSPAAATSYTMTWPAAVGAANQILRTDATGILSWVTPNAGTVTSVDVTFPAIFSVTGGPVTTSGTIAATLASQTQNTIFSAPDGANGAPTFRALANADLPTVTAAKGGTGLTTLTSGSLLVGNGAGNVNFLTGGTLGNVIYATGAATWASGTPTAAGLVAQGGNSFAATMNVGTNDGNTFNLETNNVARVAIDTSGGVQVNGQAWSAVATSAAATPLTWDANLSNTMRWSLNTVSITTNIHNMKAGASYMLVVSGTGTGTNTINCFSDAGVTSLPSGFVPANGNRVAGALNKSIYTLMSDGQNCLITWITGF